MAWIGPNVRKCSMCGATFNSLVAVFVESLGLPDGIFSVCGYCEEVCRDREPPKDQTLSPSRDLRYTEPAPYQKFANDNYPRTVGLLDPAFAFRTSLLHLESLRAIPMEVVWLARLFQLKKDEEMMAQFGSLEAPELTPEQASSFDLALNLRLQKWFYQEPQEARRAFAEHYGPTIVRDFAAPHFWRGLHSLLRSQITGAWTAFEALAGDLWIAALNSHPTKLAALAGGKFGDSDNVESSESNDPETAGNETADEYCAKSEKWVRVAALQRHRFDVQHHMGTILADKFDFSVLSEVREAYWRAFPKRRSAIKSAIMNPALDALSLVRNVIVHNSGKVDAEYLSVVRRLDRDSYANLHAVQENEGIPITAPFVEGLVRPVIQVGIDLIKAVDDWITPPKKEAKE